MIFRLFCNSLILRYQQDRSAAAGADLTAEEFLRNGQHAVLVGVGVAEEIPSSLLAFKGIAPLVPVSYTQLSRQPGFPAEAASLRREGAAYSFCGIDSVSLCSGDDLYKSCACCFGERKYFSPASLIKISDKVHPLAGLRDVEILA